MAAPPQAASEGRHAMIEMLTGGSGWIVAAVVLTAVFIVPVLIVWALEDRGSAEADHGPAVTPADSTAGTR
ncbi:hypothetical protein GCM10027160_29360 [Streptomyces calidiresistens]